MLGGGGSGEGSCEPYHSLKKKLWANKFAINTDGYTYYIIIKPIAPVSTTVSGIRTPPINISVTTCMLHKNEGDR
jgi:hypothetical protein